MSVSNISASTYSSNQDSHEKGVQTVIKVFPFVLPPYVAKASVTADKKFCTILSLESSQNSTRFYNLLQYCPYHDIEEQSLKVINLPRKTKLQFVTQTFSEETLKKISLADDDGVAELCDDLLIRLRSGNKTTFKDADTQTELTTSKTCQARRKERERGSTNSGGSGTSDSLNSNSSWI